jgi:hypothetical protein
MTNYFYSTLLVLSLLITMWVGPLQGQTGRDFGVSPVPDRISSQFDGSDRPRVSWGAVLGHGSQTGLHTNDNYDVSEYTLNYGTDQRNWNFGDPMENRSASDRTHTLYMSSYGFDVISFNTRGGPDNEADIYCLQNFAHTPFPFWPGPAGGDGDKAKFDQLHYFNADPSTPIMDMIDFSPLGVTHPDQLLWFPGENGYQYSYLMINDNDGDVTDVAAAVLIRADRTFGEISLTDNIIYAKGQTTYNVYRRELGSSSYQRIVTGLTGTSFTDLDPLPAGATYEYVITSNTLMFGESDYSASTNLTVPGSLPVEWLSFDAVGIGPGAVRLAWSTASESNSASFEVERSVDGRSFVRVGSVAAAGQSQRTLEYDYTDAEAPGGELYYRLRQVDFDGATRYSDLRRVQTLEEVAPALSLYPNPVQSHAHLAGLVPGQPYHLRVIDLSGRVVQQADIRPMDTDPLALAVQSLLPGVYQVLISDPNQTYLISLSMLRQ